MRKGMKRVEIVKLPDWVLPGLQKDGASMAAALALASLEDKWIRLDAATQRKLLGFPVFGKRAILVDSNDGSVLVYQSALGGGYTRTLDWSDVTRLAHLKRMID